MPAFGTPAGYIVMAQCLLVLAVIVAIVVGIVGVVLKLVGGRTPR